MAVVVGADPELEDGQRLADHHHFRQHLPVPLKEFLHDQAEADLRRFNINEPLQWEPPSHWVEIPHWPGHDDAMISTSLAAELAAQSPVERELAKDLGLTTTHLRLYFESRALSIPLPHELRSPRTRQARPKGVPRTGPLASTRLRYLYQEQRLTLDRIAELAGCSHSTVALAIHEAGIPKRTRRPAGYLTKVISRTWLENEYHHKGRSSPDIASELGVRKHEVMRLVLQPQILRL
ncbi:hypothetical protein [Streptomyces sp. NPDC054794]